MSYNLKGTKAERKGDRGSLSTIIVIYFTINYKIEKYGFENSGNQRYCAQKL